ncbi:MAG: PaaI family thioesterase, partial [Comamonadaceae bacterium]
MDADTTLQQWMAREREVNDALAGGAGCGVARPEQVAGRTGLDTLKAMLRGELPYPPIARTLAFQLVEANEGHAVFQGAPGPDHLNPMGGIHGGWYATLLDSALGCAVHT